MPGAGRAEPVGAVFPPAEASRPWRITLRHLQCLCAVADTGFNLARAADSLHVTHTVVSTQLRQLEEEIGVALVLRDGGRVTGFTEAGERSLAWARRALLYVGRIRAVAAEGKGGEGGTIALATSHTYANHVLLPAVLAFRRSFPRVDIQVLQGLPEQVAELVRAGAATLGVTQLPAGLPRELVAVPFLSLRHALVAPVGHPLLADHDLTLERIAAHPLVLEQGSTQIRQAFLDRALPVNVAVEALDVSVVKTFVAAGLGIGIVPAVAHSPVRDAGLGARDAGHLFAATASAVLLRRQSQVRHYACAFLELLDAELDRGRVQEIVACGSIQRETARSS